MNAHDYIVNFVKGINKVNAELVKVNEKRQGTYNSAVLAAIVSGTADKFTSEMEGIMQAIRNNDGGLARTLGCSPAKKQPEGQPKNKPIYTVPSAVSSVKSYLTSALEYGVDLGTEENPNSFGSIRTEVSAIKAEEKRAELQGDDKVRSDLVEVLELLSHNVPKLAGDGLAQVLASAQAALALAHASVKADLKASADSKAEAAKVKAEAKKAAPKKPAAKKAAPKKAASKATSRKLAEAA